MITSDPLDVGASDAQIGELAIVERRKLTDGLLISGPFLQSGTDTQLLSPFVYGLRFRVLRPR